MCRWRKNDSQGRVGDESCVCARCWYRTCAVGDSAWLTLPPEDSMRREGYVENGEIYWQTRVLLQAKNSYARDGAEEEEKHFWPRGPLSDHGLIIVLSH